LGFCILFLVLGVLRIQIAEFDINNDRLSKLNDNFSDIVLTGVVLNEPDIRDKVQKLEIKINDSTVLVTATRYPDFQYLDKIKIVGKLKTPGIDDDGGGQSYKNYLMKDGIYSVVDFPKIELVGKEKPNTLQVVYSGILWFKQKLRESIRKNYLPPQSSILEGTILGDNGVMSSDLKNKLNITGLRHIIAVSGTHVVILTSIIISALLAIGISRNKSFYITIIFICLYVILTGMVPSGIRAGIMGGLFLLAQKLGRQANSSRIIVLAGAIMLLQNPLLLVYDIGFQLSFLAVLGLIYFEPLIRTFLNFAAQAIFNLKIEEKKEAFLSMFTTTFAAQIFTLPIMIFNFGNISWIAPITNILILPIVYYLMLFGFLSSFIGILSSTLGWILSVPCYLLLSYFIWVINFFGQPWAAKTIQNVSWYWLLFYYIIISFITRFFRKKIAAF